MKHVVSKQICIEMQRLREERPIPRIKVTGLNENAKTLVGIVDIRIIGYASQIQVAPVDI
jgi:hypothetical protein